ncbi:collybistin, putative [Pediculus humanus corporis]|uniref:Collybistin, putative n=1 Tax=Pediculus humanus subsp. corporis TaxID=121224 RepID=E0VKU8_PEDHC|nr:collybistin, putative [Pediculus humanus corporis]EEB14004.1 collybistin, putative [Pediculus humanus corporis]
MMETAEEAHIVTNYLNQSRSREAARNLLLHRQYNQLPPEKKKDKIEQSFSKIKKKDFQKRKKPSSFQFNKNSIENFNIQNTDEKKKNGKHNSNSSDGRKNDLNADSELVHSLKIKNDLHLKENKNFLPNPGIGIKVLFFDEKNFHFQFLSSSLIFQKEPTKKNHKKVTSNNCADSLKNRKLRKNRLCRSMSYPFQRGKVPRVYKLNIHRSYSMIYGSQVENTFNYISIRPVIAHFLHESEELSDRNNWLTRPIWTQLKVKPYGTDRKNKKTSHLINVKEKGKVEFYSSSQAFEPTFTDNFFHSDDVEEKTRKLNEIENDASLHFYIRNRTFVIKELIKNERDFVQILTDIAEGYINECKKRTDLFSKEMINSIFGNLEDLLIFQKKFMINVEENVNPLFPHKSCLGKIFLDHERNFKMYALYCVSYPTAIIILQSLYSRDVYTKFFEACRLKRGLNNISLDGYLLTPIQRICKYPLQLAELLKWTEPSHPDHNVVKEALQAMKKVATLIDDQRKTMDDLEKLVVWQSKIFDWKEEEEDVIIKSCQMLYRGEGTRIISKKKNTNVTMFLFDHQLIFCKKKNFFNKNYYTYKGRINLDFSKIINLPDGPNREVEMLIKNGIKIYVAKENKWEIICYESKVEKNKWIKAFIDERKIVEKMKREGLELPVSIKKLAKVAVETKNMYLKSKV